MNFETILRQFQGISQQQLSHLQHVIINALFLELDSLPSSSLSTTTNFQQTPVTSGLHFQNLVRQVLAVFDIVRKYHYHVRKQIRKDLFLRVFESSNPSQNCYN